MPPMPQKVQDGLVQRSINQYYQVFTSIIHRADSPLVDADKYRFV